MLARSAGFRNFQHLRAQTEARDRLVAPEAASPEIDFVEIGRMARFFDAKGRLTQWPAKSSHRINCLWVFWSRIPAREVLNEYALNKLLQAGHLFGDPALLRRELYDNRLVSRTPDCREYRRIERKPPPEALAFIHHLERRRTA